MGWLIVLAVLLLLAILPVGIMAVYNGGGAAVDLIVGPVRIPLYPRKKTASNRRKQAGRNNSSKDDFESQKSVKKKSGGKLTDFFPLVQLIIDFLVDFRRKIRISRLELILILAGDDPCDLSINYGRAWAALGNLMPQLERLFVIKKRHLEVECDFTATQTLIDARIDMTITVAGLVSILGYHSIRILRKYFNILKKSKAVQ